MKKKKLLWGGVLITFIVVIFMIALFVKPKDNSTGAAIQKGENSNIVQSGNKNKGTREYIRTELEEGILYSVTGEKEEPDMIIGDNYFDTTISDMMLNFNQFKGKKVEVEGMYLSNPPYTFVGRYSTSNLCQYCPTGYSYIEYELTGDIQEELKEEESWIKIVGTFEEGQDVYGTEEDPQYQSYYYLKVLSIEIMNERGQETVNN